MQTFLSWLRYIFFPWSIIASQETDLNMLMDDLEDAQNYNRILETNIVAVVVQGGSDIFLPAETIQFVVNSDELVLQANYVEGGVRLTVTAGPLEEPQDEAA